MTVYEHDTAYEMVRRVGKDELRELFPLTDTGLRAAHARDREVAAMKIVKKPAKKNGKKLGYNGSKGMTRMEAYGKMWTTGTRRAHERDYDIPCMPESRIASVHGFIYRTHIVGIYLTFGYNHRAFNANDGRDVSYYPTVIAQASLDGGRLGNARSVNKSRSLHEAWLEITEEYAKKIGIERPNEWLEVEPDPKQFERIMKNMRANGHMVSDYDLRWLKAHAEREKKELAVNQSRARRKRNRQLSSTL